MNEIRKQNNRPTTEVQLMNVLLEQKNTLSFPPLYEPMRIVAELSNSLCTMHREIFFHFCIRDSFNFIRPSEPEENSFWVPLPRYSQS